MAVEKLNSKLYEEVLVLHPDASDTEKKQLFSTSSKVIKEHSGKILRTDTWGLRVLANPEAKRVTRGWYFHMIFQAQPETVNELRRRLRINDHVLYFHHEKISNKKPVDEYVSEFLDGFRETQKRALERIAKFQKKARA